MKKVALAVAVVGLLCFVGCGGGGGGEDWFGDGTGEYVGKIVYCSRPYAAGVNTLYHLYVTDPDGANKVELPFFGRSMFAPVWSPGNVGIAYSASVENRDRIFVMTPDGRVNNQLTAGNSYDKFPTWSPDGRYLAYISYRGGDSTSDSTPNLFVMDTQGGNERQLTFATGDDTVLWPSWSPVGDVIAYTYNSSEPGIGQRICTINSDGSGMTEMAGPAEAHRGDSEPDWSPDGKTIYFFSNRSSQMEIWKVNCDESGTAFSAPQQVSDLSGAGMSPDHRPRVSPDGSKIVFYGSGADWNDIGSNLYVINVDGTGLTNITRSRDADEWADW